MLKESRIESGLVFWALALFVCLMLVVTLGKDAARMQSDIDFEDE